MPFLPDKDAASTYEALSKVNYQNLPPANPQWDWDNTKLAPAICNVAGLTQTVPRAALSVSLNPSDGYMTLLSWSAVWGNITTTAPACHHVSTGIYSFTFPSVVSDEYNASFGIFNTHTINFLRGFGNLQNPGGLASVSVSVSANVLTVRLYDHTNALNDFSGITLDLMGCY